MPHQNGCPDGRSQLFTLPDDKVVVERHVLREILSLLSLTTPIVGAPRPPERHWSGIKSQRLYKARRLLRRAIAEGGSL